MRPRCAKSLIRTLTLSSAVFVLTSCVALSSTWATPPASPGSLPQTSIEPNFTTGLSAQMNVLWRSIVNDSPSLGQTVFFPRAAYLQMKTGQIPEPSQDFSNRLIALFDLDINAYHSAVAGKGVTLIRVEADPAFAQWIAPGVCENKIGYWHLPGVRLVFGSRGSLKSFEVASLISWRGVWYVVHLGPNPRSRNVGTVDGLMNGVGRPGPGGGC